MTPNELTHLYGRRTDGTLRPAVPDDRTIRGEIANSREDNPELIAFRKLKL
jgi:hypothetical protein